jgi:hypothetical protein
MKHGRTRWLGGTSGGIPLVAVRHADARANIDNRVSSGGRCLRGIEFECSGCFFRQRKQSREGELVVSDIGPSIEGYVRPLEALKRVTVFDLDETKCVPVLFSIGYRYLPSPDTPGVNRMEPVVMFHLFLITDKNRADLDCPMAVTIGATAID